MTQVTKTSSGPAAQRPTATPRGHAQSLAARAQNVGGHRHTRMGCTRWSRALRLSRSDRSELTEEHSAAVGRGPYLLAQLREAFGRVAYTQKTHEKQADICFSKHRWQQGVLIALTAVSSGTFLVAVVGQFATAAVTSLITSTVAVLVTWVTLGAKTFRFHEEAEAHRDIASQLWDVRESYISLIADLMSGEISDVDARARRDQLQDAAREVYSSAPRTGVKAYHRAQDGLKNNEELTFSSRELDLLLPEALRLNEGEA